MTLKSRDSVSFVETHGIVLESGRGPVPNLAAAVAGEPIRGSWWGHPRGHEIFAATRAVRSNCDILVCRLLNGKVTYVHRRLWPAIVRLADEFAPERLAAIREIHTTSGAHQVVETPFSEWLPAEVSWAADNLSKDDAIRLLGDALAAALLGDRRSN